MKQTPSQTVGPFYSLGLTQKTTNLLASDTTQGEKIRIVGCVFDGDGKSVPDAMSAYLRNQQNFAETLPAFKRAMRPRRLEERK